MQFGRTGTLICKFLSIHGWLKEESQNVIISLAAENDIYMIYSLYSTHKNGKFTFLGIFLFSIVVLLDVNET